MRRTEAWLATVLTAAAILATPSRPANADGERGAHRELKNGAKKMNGVNHGLAVSVECDRSYDAGFPILVSVEVRNVDHGTFLTFEPIDLFDVPGPVSFTLTSGDGHEWSWPSASHQEEEPPSGMPFRPGEAWRSLYDLSEINFEVPPGHYKLVAEFALAGGYGISKPVPIEILRSDVHDHAIAKRLRASNDKHEPSWISFVTENWSTPNTAGLSEKARERLAYYLYLHRAAYGPIPIAKLDPTEPERLFGTGLLESEAALLRLEILHAAKQPEANGIAAAIRERWPGLAWRLRDIKQGHGLLTVLRRDGLHSIYAPKNKPRPYTRP
jgi:hypothetical protein